MKRPCYTNSNRLLVRIGYFVLIMSLVLGLAACDAGRSVSTDPIADSESPDKQTTLTSDEATPIESVAIEAEPTGYTDGGIQIPMIYYQDQLLMLGDIVSEDGVLDVSEQIESRGLSELGSIREETNFRWPNKNFEAARLLVGTKIYLDEDDQTIYLVTDNQLRSLEPYTGELYDLRDPS